MKTLPFFILLALLLASCRTMPVIKTPAPSTEQINFACPAPFLKEPSRFLHTIETQMAGQTRSAVIGVTVADPITRFISCAILTAEGIVLFEAEASPALKVLRALPPFDSADFAENMIEDIKLIFFAPAGKMLAKGALADGTAICRYREQNGNWIDVLARIPESIEINKYSAAGCLQRRIKLNRTEENIYQRIELTAKEMFDYALTMTLLEVEPLDSEWTKKEAEGGGK